MVLILFFNACSQNTKVIGNQYSLEECKKELLEAKDYVDDEGIDLIIVEKKKR